MIKYIAIFIIVSLVFYFGLPAYFRQSNETKQKLKLLLQYATLCMFLAFLVLFLIVISF